MSTRNRLSKSRLLHASLAVAIAVWASSCARVSDRSPEEKAVLASSTFYPGEVAAGMMSTQQTGTDGGSIPAPGSGGSGGDGGSIPIPGGSGGGSSGGDSGGSSGGDSGSAGGDTGGSSGGSAGGGSSGGDSAGNSGGGSSGGSQGGGSDGGTIPGSGSGGSGGSDGGTIGGGGNSGGGADGGTAGNGGGTTPGGNDGGSSGGGSAGNDGGSSGGGSSGGGDVAGNDGGTIPGGNNGGGGNDGGTVPGGGNNGGGNDGGTNPGGDDHAGNDPGTNPGGNDPGTNPGGNDGGTNPGGDDHAGNDPGTNPGGNDGGTIPGGGDPGDGDDGGTIPDPKVALCHIPPGNPENAQTIDVDQNAVSAHLAHGDVMGACPAEEHELVNLLLNRVCSVRRSGTRAIFFEEARRPILSFEATPPEPALSRQQARNPRSTKGISWFASFFNRSTSYASVGYGYQLAIGPSMMQKIDLGHVDLNRGPYRSRLDINLTILKIRYPNNWENALIEASVCDDTNNDGMCSDEDDNHTLSLSKLSFMARHVPDAMTFDVWAGRNLTLARNPTKCEKQYSPIVLDLKGNGIQLTPAEEGVAFDLNDTGSPIYSGWVSGMDDAFLVRDLNGNGNIDSGAELFGSATKLLDGRRAPNGFVALMELDDDHDGLITPADRVYRVARLWLDSNYSGTTERGELIPLSKVGVLSMNLNYVEVREVDPYGNETRQRSTFNRQVRGLAYPMLMVDIWFRTLTNW